MGEGCEMLRALVCKLLLTLGVILPLGCPRIECGVTLRIDDVLRTKDHARKAANEI